ncbi:class II aldolase/adducin family protein [Rhodococcus pyridinivorans]|uniref:class II aldolase/adducin family protein n=1 Tax=Rhodococcus pyridinivorans TaxID=103816 RepID=UPI001E3648E3|nr:class II aldolase/adducin family protein [Rhodococcus pyridinivorans]MCD5418813.1 class II aldolase/adducin family protein [Rhodococcus pyridinivorans]
MTDTRDALVRAGARLTELGLSPGSSGNLSIRVGSTMVMSPTGVSLGALDAEQLSVLDLNTGHLLDGPSPSKEFPLHRALYARSGGSGAVVHLHSPYAAAWSCTIRHDKTSAIPPLTPYFVMKVGRTPLIDYAAPGDRGQAEALQALPVIFEAALLQNHGPIVAKGSLDAAIDAAIEIEEVCKLLILLGTHPVRHLTEEEAAHLADKYDVPWGSS